MSTSNSVYKLLLSQFLVLVIILMCGGIAWKLYESRPEAPEIDAAVPLLNVDVVEADQLDFQEIIYGFGTVVADREVIVAAQVSGEIIEADSQLEVGRQVQAATLRPSSDSGITEEAPGDVLIRIDPSDYEQRQQQAISRTEEAKTEIERLDVTLANTRRQLKQSEAVLETLQDDLERKRTAASRQASSKTEVSRSLLEVQRYEESTLQLQNQIDSLPVQRLAAEQRLASSEAEAKQIANDLKRTTIMPPFDGVISEVNVELGQYVRSGEPLFRLTDLMTVEVPVALPLDQFLRLQELQNQGLKPAVELEASDRTKTKWQGDLVRVSPEADAGSRTVKVFIEVTNQPSQTPLLPGTFVTAAIDGPVMKDRVLIPREAIVSGSVFVVTNDNTVERRAVQIARTLQSMAEVKSGVERGENVVITNLDLLTDGREVNVQQRLTLQDEVSGLKKSRIRLLSDEPSTQAASEDRPTTP